MFKIVNGTGDVLVLPEKHTVTVDKLNPLFNDADKFFQDLSYPGSVPLTPEVKRFIRLAHLPESQIAGYNFPVTCYVDEILLSQGNFNCAIRGKNLEFNLELNYTSLNSLINGIKLTDIRNNDGQHLASYDEYKALMQDTIIHPEKYPFCFIPIKNVGQSGDIPPVWADDFRPWINNFNAATGQFELTSSENSRFENGQQPYFKLVHVLKLVLHYLGYEPAGDFFTDPAYNNLYVYTRYSTTLTDIYGCMKYMPNMLITDYLKQMRERYHLSIDMNNATGIATVRSFSSIKNSSTTVDLTAYLVDHDEGEAPEGSGYSVTLKSDQQDEMYQTGGDDDQYPPLFKLTAGDGAEPVELEISTLKTEDLSTPGTIGKRYPITNQTVINYYAWTKPDAVTILPPDLDPGNDSAYNPDPSLINNWPLRVIRYLGYQALSDGTHWPAAESVELDELDKEWFQFIKDSKIIKSKCVFPNAFFAGLNTTEKYIYRTPGRNYVELIIDKIESDIVSGQRYTQSKITARSLSNELDSRVTIQPVKAADPLSPYTMGYFAAYFDSKVQGFFELNVEVVGIITGAGNIYTVPAITNPTNVKGAGGVAVPLVYVSGPDFFHQQIQIRVRQGNPKFMEIHGFKYVFTWDAAGYWYIDIITTSSRYGIEIADHYWISF